MRSISMNMEHYAMKNSNMHQCISRFVRAPKAQGNIFLEEVSLSLQCGLNTKSVFIKIIVSLVISRLLSSIIWIIHTLCVAIRMIVTLVELHPAFWPEGTM